MKPLRSISYKMIATRYAFFLVCVATVVSASLRQMYLDAKKNEGWQTSVRRWLHQHPELCFQEHATSEKIQQELEKLGISYSKGWSRPRLSNGTTIGGTGIVAEIGTGKSPCVGLRADMDGLPVGEQANVSFPSLNAGKMHACGHDAHMSMLLGAAKLLKERENELQGTVRLIFQPAEEGCAGAKYMVEEGVLSRSPAVESIFGVHVHPFSPTGSLASRSGPLMAGSQLFDIRVEGTGGHAAVPSATRDPIAAAASIVHNINALVARRVSAVEHSQSGVLSITSINTSRSYNVIPARVDLQGTIRALSSGGMQRLKKDLQNVVDNMGDIYGVKTELSFVSPAYPVTLNDDALFRWAQQALEGDVLQSGGLAVCPPIMAAEDFSFYGEAVPALFLLLGTGSGKDSPTNITVHSPKFVLDEEALPYGSAVLSHVAIERLKTLSRKGLEKNKSDL